MAKVFLVYAHPEPQSFNGAMKDLAVETLTQAGHSVWVSDLYAMKFDPVAAPKQFPQRADPGFFRLQEEQRHAAATGAQPPDVAAEQEKLFWADLVVFQFPLWWGSLPAIMKGWVDRVFSAGTIYGQEASTLAGRQALLSVTTSNRTDPEEGARQVKAELSHVLNNMLALARLEPLEPFIVFGPRGLTEADRSHCLGAYEARLLSIAREIG